MRAPSSSNPAAQCAAAPAEADVRSPAHAAAAPPDGDSLRRSGIDVVGRIPWGTHFCQFYEDPRDLLEILVPYFREGLAANEFCMWITSEPLRVEGAKAALALAVPDLERRIAEGQIEILDYSEWYVRSGRFSSDEVLQGWVDKLAAARARGHEGLRLTGNTFWLEAADWADFTRYEEAVNNVIGSYRMLAICTYSLAKCGAMEIADVVANHEFALIRRAGRWEIIESAHHRKTEQALRESEAFANRVLASSLNGLYIHDLKTGANTFTNPQYATLTGYTLDDLSRMSAPGFFALFHPDDQALVTAHLRAVSGAADGEVLEIEYRFRRADGQWRWFFSRDTVFSRDDDGSVRQLLGTFLDITERRQMQEALGAANEALETANLELEAQTAELETANNELAAQAAELRTSERALRDADRRKDEFLAMLAHELRNPLAAVATALQLMERLRPSSAALWRARDTAARQAAHMARMLDDLLDVSRITRGKVSLKRELTELAPILSSALEAAAPIIEAREHHLSVSVPREALHVHGDPVRLAQVVSNLLSNAAKYTQPGGRIELLVEGSGIRSQGPALAAQGSGSARERRSLVSEPSEAVIRVRDNGSGIAPELLPRVFDLFVQADRSLDRSQGGLGIGLTMVRSLVQMHGGQVEAHSGGLGQGSEFVVRLPVSSEFNVERSELPGAQRGTLNSERGTAGRRILVVDDNADAAEMLAGLLELDGHEVATAHSGPAAVLLAAEHHPEVVLLDIGLPQMDGYEVARRIRQDPALSDVVLIAVTGYGQDEDRERSRRAGFNHHLVKPVDPDTLRRALADGA
ncbi:MAG: MEDS domain-containing protein [Armatimonadetes bacterium]|nr:MEDS domain-containing protein [Armatimonadota bacterium]